MEDIKPSQFGDGWLFKGLRLVLENPARLGDADLADWLGVGKNMAKAIHHWLLATGLAEKDPSWGKRTRVLRPTALGRLVWERDRYFLMPGTWWAIHVPLDQLPRARVQLELVLQSLQCGPASNGPFVSRLFGRHLISTGSRMPAQRTLERDVGCLLGSYATSLPGSLEIQKTRWTAH